MSGTPDVITPGTSALCVKHRVHIELTPGDPIRIRHKVSKDLCDSQLFVLRMTIQVNREAMQAEIVKQEALDAGRKLLRIRRCNQGVL